MKKLNVALIGYKFMGKAHSYALMAAPFFFKHGVDPVRKVIVGRHEAPLKQAAADFGWEEYSTDWREVIKRPDIDVVDIASPPNTHAEIAIAAAQAGKHIFCEKPFTISLEEAERALAAVQQAGVKHMLGFNYRRVPAIGLAKNLVQSGRLGRIYHWRAVYLQDWIMNPEFPRIWKLNKAIAGSGSHHELNSHLIDLALYLVGKITSVAGLDQTFIKERPAPAETTKLATKLTAEKSGAGLETVDVDDATLFLARFANNAVGSFESTRFAAGRRNHNRFEINGSKGSIAFNLEELNRLEYYDSDAPKDVPGFRSIMVTEDCHPYMAHWWPPGHLVGYQNSFVNQFADFFRAIIEDRKPEPGFEEGLENQKVLDAVSRSITAHSWVRIDQ
jgi:predicted dehydrogenase